MSFCKPCHMPFRKLIPPFTLTVVGIPKKKLERTGHYMSCNIIIITILKIFPTKKLKSKCLMYVVMCMLSKVNLKKENISADLVIWIINKQCLEIPLTGYVLHFFSIMT